MVTTATTSMLMKSSASSLEKWMSSFMLTFQRGCTCVCVCLCVCVCVSVCLWADDRVHNCVVSLRMPLQGHHHGNGDETGIDTQQVDTRHGLGRQATANGYRQPTQRDCREESVVWLVLMVLLKALSVVMLTATRHLSLPIPRLQTSLQYIDFC